MITIIKTTDMNFCGGLQKLKFEFEFDNGSSLPINTYQLGLTTYVISNGSTAKNIKDNTYYEYNDGEWIKTLGNVTPSTSTNTITENGNYSIPANTISGINNVDVDVESGEGGGSVVGSPKLLTPSSIADTINEMNLLLVLGDFTPQVYTNDAGYGNIPNTNSSGTTLCLIYATAPITMLRLSNLCPGYPRNGYALFTWRFDGRSPGVVYGKSENMLMMSDTVTSVNSLLQDGKTYLLHYETYQPQATSSFAAECVELFEYDEPIQFTVE